tara:strand:- start:825 stop:1235 length:411 start_codon:yes stop_codon:yes gene_type:complete
MTTKEGYDPTDPNGSGPEQDAMKNFMEQLSQKDSVVRTIMNDQRIMKLVEYDITKGYTTTPKDNKDLQVRFNEFKKLVKRGSFTLAELEDDVYARWGIDEKPRTEMPDMKPLGETSNSIGFYQTDTQEKTEGEKVL